MTLPRPFPDFDVDAITGFAHRTGAWDFMHTTWGWPATESLHFIALSTLLGTVGLFDLRMLGLFKGIPMAALHRLIPFGVAAFAVNVATGALFFINASDQYAWNPSFRLKLACMAIAGLNVLAFYATTAKAVKAAGPEDDAPLAAKIMGAVSLSAWIGVIIFGRLITDFRPPFHWDYLFG